ncbi:MAG: HisA/HisF-related TIM barrel protein [Caldilineales bacterium]|nr:HisA/HisF-related TIM barrel protein [Caldilineales bacterium]
MLRLSGRLALWLGFFALASALFLGLVYLLSRRPVITSVPITPTDGELVLVGQGFGDRQGASTVEATFGGKATTLDAIVQWSDTRTVAALPSEASSGTVRVIRRGILGERASEAVPFVIRLPGLPSRPFGYEVPVQPESPWPTFRRDHRNTGRSPLPAVYTGDRPWSFTTGKGIFSTPVVDGDGVIYVGSADHVFYALYPDGREKWRFETGEIIDSAAALARAVSIPVIASGGISTLEDIRALCEAGAIAAAITGRAIYEGTLDFAAAQRLADRLSRGMQ